jgi:predicted ATPase/class 3 adenylate cyclase/Tfp pilus assembly protein PilF
MMPEYPSGTVAFLFTDIEGSTALWERDRPAMASAVNRHLTLMRGAIEAHHGVLFKTIGDAVQAAFPTAPDAVAAALDAQVGLGNEPWDATGPLRVRMGIHLGAATPRDGDYLAPALNRLSRLLSAGYGGQVLLTQAAAALAHHALPAGAALRDLGEHRLRDLHRHERVFQLLHSGLPDAFPPLKTLDIQRHNLPSQATPFLGRAQDVGRIRELVHDPEVRLVTLTGPGGVGKTRLAQHVAGELVEGFPDGVWFIDLAPLTDPTLVAQTIAGTLGVREAGERPLLEALAEHVSSRRLLLVLDNFEHVMAAATVVADLIRNAPSVKALVTSRAPLRLQGEREAPILPLALPAREDGEPPDFDEIMRSDAVQLFVARAQAARPDFTLTPEIASAVVEICERLDGLPLAIELAAARVRVLTPEALLARLDDRLRMLTGGPRDAPARQQALRQTIAWSYDLLAPTEQALFRRFAVFAGNASLPATEAVIAQSGELDAFDGLATLVEQSLVQQSDDVSGEPRFGMLQSIRAFGLEQLTALGEESDVRDAHARYFAADVQEAEPAMFGPEQGAWFDRFETEHDDLRSALRWLLDRREVETALEFAGALWIFWLTRGYPSEGSRWLSEALSVGSSSDPAAHTLALVGAGMLAETQGDYGRATALLDEALALARASGIERAAARALSALSVVSENQGDYPLATARLEEALALYRALDDRPGIALALLGLGALAAYPGDTARAASLLEEAATRCRALGDDVGLALAMANLGRLAFLEGDLTHSKSRTEEALTIFRRLGDAPNVATVLANLGEVAQHQGDVERAVSLYDEGLALLRELGYKREIAETLVTRAEAETARGNAVAAAAFLDESLMLADEVDDRGGLARGLESLAALAVARDASAPATRLLAAADSLRETIGAPLPAVYHREHDRVLSTIHGALDSSQFERVWSDGRRLSPEAAVAAGRELAGALMAPSDLVS